MQLPLVEKSIWYIIGDSLLTNTMKLTFNKTQLEYKQVPNYKSQVGMYYPMYIVFSSCSDYR